MRHLLFQIGLVVGIADEDIENTKLREIELKVRLSASAKILLLLQTK